MPIEAYIDTIFNKTLIFQKHGLSFQKQTSNVLFLLTLFALTQCYFEHFHGVSQ